MPLKKPITGIAFRYARRVRAAVIATPSKAMKRQRCIPSSCSHNLAKTSTKRHGRKRSFARRRLSMPKRRGALHAAASQLSKSIRAE